MQDLYTEYYKKWKNIKEDLNEEINYVNRLKELILLRHRFSAPPGAGSRVWLSKKT